MDMWNACPEHDPESLKGRRCFGGIDLSSKRDITALVLMFPEDGHAVRCWFWLPESMLDKKDFYQQWVDAGFLTLTPGNVVDYAYIMDQVVKASEEYEIIDIGYDPWNASQTAVELQENRGIKMVEFRQGYYTMNEPTKEFEVKIVSGKFSHNANPVLRWMASNVACRSDPAGNIKVDKEKSSEKVDGIVAAVMALGRCMVNEEEEPFPYTTRGIQFL